MLRVKVVEVYTITMSAQSHMLPGSIMKTGRREREKTLSHSRCVWRRWLQTSPSKALHDLGSALILLTNCYSLQRRRNRHASEEVAGVTAFGFVRDFSVIV